MTFVLTLPGLWNSGPQHWQTHWERTHPHWKRISQRDWDNPQREEWVAALDAEVKRSATPPVLAAHSLSCSLISHWAKETGGHGIRGAFIVAPSDVEGPNYPPNPVGFAPMPLLRLPFPSMLVASTNDEYVSVERATLFANAWGSRLVFIGDAGHINGASGHGPWPEGETLLLEFMASLPA